ncbi:hypothetical protein AALP_AA8G194500 [Arabis alpina]|uniref:Uncharacterized protein n=1 Tax=Arabis alpina TaxID=50452 RepID=A0A087G828_ARAAL|nr:hypothetical protein AALP_AA8G194500 [Arabis alpina]
MGAAWAPMSTAWTPMRPGTSVSLGMTSVPGNLGIYSASCWLCDLSDAAFMTSPAVTIASKVPSLEPKDSTGLDKHPDDPRSSVFSEPDDPRSSGLILYPDEVLGLPHGCTEESWSSVAGAIDPRTPCPSLDLKTRSELETPMPSSHVVDPTRMRVGDVSVDEVDGVGISGVIGIDADGSGVQHADVTETVGGTIPLNDEDPDLPSGHAFVSSSSSSSGSRASNDESDDENTFVEVEQPKKAKKAKKKAGAKVHLDPPGSSLSNEKSLRLLRKKCGISEEIVLVAPTLADRADAPPLGYMTLFENYFDKCLLWIPLPRFLMRFLVVHGVCLTQINPRGIKHLLGIYVLSRECGVDISTENLSYLADFRTRGLSEELKHSVTNSSGMALIAGFPSKDDHFEYRFFFAEISERTVEAGCTDLVKTRWERRVKPTLPKVSKEFLTAMHKELSSGNGNWKRSFSRKRIERALSAEILPGKILGRGLARRSFREQAALEVAAKTKRSFGSSASRVVVPMALSPTASLARAKPSRPLASKTLPPPSSGEVAEFRRLSAERACISSSKGKGVDRMTPSKRQRVDSHPAATAGGQASASHVGGLLREKSSELSLFFDRLLSEHDGGYSFQGQRTCLQLRGELSSASDLQRSRIEDAVAEVKDEMARGFSGRTSEVAGLFAEIGGKAQNDMLNLSEIDANLEFIGLLQGSEPPDLSTEVKSLHGRRHPIYDAHDMFADLLASVQRVLGIPGIPVGAAEASVAAAADDDDEASDDDDVEATDDDGVA